MTDNKREIPKEYFIETIMMTLYFALFSVVTLGLGAGGAFAALYKGLFRVLRAKPRDHARGEQFKEDFLSTMPHSLIVLIILGGLAYASYTVLTLDESSFMTLFFGGFIAFETALIAAYIFPALAMFKFPSVTHAFKTALLMGHFHALTTAKLIGAAVISFLGAIEFSLYLLPFSIILYVFLSARALHPTFMKYVERIEAQQKQDASSETVNAPEETINTEEDPFDQK